MSIDVTSLATTREKGVLTKVGEGPKAVESVTGVLTNIRVDETYGHLNYDIRLADGTLAAVPCAVAMQGLLHGSDVGSIVVIKYLGKQKSKNSDKSYGTFDVKVVAPGSVPADKLADVTTQFPTFGKIPPMAFNPKAEPRAKTEAAAAATATYNSFAEAPESVGNDEDDDDLPF